MEAEFTYIHVHSNLVVANLENQFLRKLNVNICISSVQN